MLLRADVCRDPHSILLNVSKVEDFSSKLSYLYPAASAGNENALALFTKLAIDHNDNYWLELAGDIGSSGALYYSAMRSNDAKAIRRWLKRSASLGHPQSQFEYALLQEDIDDKLKWMEASAQSGYEPAIIAMAKYMFEATDVTNSKKARFYLERAAEFDATSAYKLANVLWQEETFDKAVTLLEEASRQNYAPATTLLSVINNHSRQDLSALLDVTPEGPQCAQSIQFVATSLRSFAQALEFSDTFELDARLSTLPLCIGEPIWLKTNSLQCNANYKGEARLGCDISKITDWKTPLSFTHMVVFAEQGKANVTNGIMFLDQSDTYSVFVHELAHFAGFVDEYALPTALAEYHCTRNTAPNLVLEMPAPELTADPPDASIQMLSENGKPKSREYIPEVRASVWKTALDAHNTLQELESRQPIYHHIAKSNTCKNAGLQSFKPSQQMTFLEYHDISNIPRVYRTLWRQRLLNTAGYSAISDNLAIDAFSRGEEDAGLFWSQR